MSDRQVTCIRCNEKIKYSDAMIDDKGQFHEITLKAKENGKEETVLCFECYQNLTESDEELFENRDPIRKYL